MRKWQHRNYHVTLLATCLCCSTLLLKTCYRLSVSGTVRKQLRDTDAASESSPSWSPANFHSIIALCAAVESESSHCVCSTRACSLAFLAAANEPTSTLKTISLSFPYLFLQGHFQKETFVATRHDACRSPKPVPDTLLLTEVSTANALQPLGPCFTFVSFPRPG
jgi:hypothetical protein